MGKLVLDWVSRFAGLISRGLFMKRIILGRDCHICNCYAKSVSDCVSRFAEHISKGLFMKMIILGIDCHVFNSLQYLE